MTATARRVQSTPNAANRRKEGPALTVVTAAAKAPKPVTDDNAVRYAECRALGHSWKHFGAIDAETEGVHRPMGMDWNSVAFRSRCLHCKTQRIKWIGRYGSRGGLDYTYPDGYQRKGETEKMTTEQWRHTWVVTAIGATR